MLTNTKILFTPFITPPLSELDSLLCPLSVVDLQILYNLMSQVLKVLIIWKLIASDFEGICSQIRLFPAYVTCATLNVYLSSKQSENMQTHH